MLKRLYRYIVNHFYHLHIKVKHSKCTIGHCTKVRFASLEDHVRIGDRCNIEGSHIGRYSYLGDNCRLPMARIGRFCSIAEGVRLAAGMHPKNYVSTSPITYKRNKWSLAKKDTFFKEYAFVGSGKWLVSIGNDVWIATDALLVCGFEPLCVGDGAIIAAGAVVTHNVPPYAIVAGSPARIIGYRFDSDVREALLSTSWWNEPDHELMKYIDSFDNPQLFIKRMGLRKHG